MYRLFIKIRENWIIEKLIFVSYAYDVIYHPDYYATLDINNEARAYIRQIWVWEELGKDWDYIGKNASFYEDIYSAYKKGLDEFLKTLRKPKYKYLSKLPYNPYEPIVPEER